MEGMEAARFPHSSLRALHSAPLSLLLTHIHPLGVRWLQLRSTSTHTFSGILLVNPKQSLHLVFQARRCRARSRPFG